MDARSVGVADSGVRSAPGRWRRDLLAPLALLALLIFFVYRDLDRQHGFRPAFLPDTASYLELAEAPTLEWALAHYRTNGYPIFLELVGGGRVDTARVPHAQFAFYSLAILLFWLGLRRYTGSGWLAFAGAAPLPFAWVVDLIPEVMTDVLAVTLTLLAVSLALLLATRPAAALLWAAVAATVFATYQVRPSAVFLVVWLPLAAAVLRVCRERRMARDLPRWLLGLGLATFLPWLLFATLRLALVGHFGLVAYGGTNLAGVTASFLDDEVVRQLPVDLQRPARFVLRQRRALGFEPMTLESDHRAAFEQYSVNIWDFAIPAANQEIRRHRKRARQGELAPDSLRPRIRRNQILTELSRAIIRARPRLYLRWVRGSFLRGLGRLAERPWIVWPFVLLGVSAFYLALRRAGGRDTGPRPPEHRLLLGILILAVSYFLIYLVTVSLVSWPSPRYTAAMIVFLPSALCMLLWEAWRRILRPLVKVLT